MTTTPANEPSESSLGALTSCSDVPRLDRNIAMETTLDIEHAHLRLDYSDARAQSHTYVIAYEDDPTCGPRADIQRVLSHALQASEATTSDAGGPSDDLRGVAERFLGFARGDRDGVPADTPIDLYVGGILAKSIPSEQQGDRSAWQGCPTGVDSYAGRDCPISALEPLAEWSGPIAFSAAAPKHPCAHPSQVPSPLSAYGAVTLTPAADLDCTSYFAVRLFVNDVGQIVAVDVVWAEP
jgi:hypothetical protein